jgi:glutamyl-tRNA synthetase
VESAEEELLTDAQMIELFDLDDVQKSPARFDMDKLNWINQKLIQRASWQELEPHIRPFLPSAWESKPEEWKKTAIAAAQKGKSLVKMADSLAFCWAAPTEFKGADEHITTEVKPALMEVAALQDYGHDPLHTAFDEILARHGLKIKALAQALRVALCGCPISPGIFDTLWLLGPDEVQERLKRWLK